MHIDNDFELQLTADEYNALNKISSGTKMDTWFWIDSEDRYGEPVDCFRDLENDNQKMYIEDALSDLLDGLDDTLKVGDYGLTKEELTAFNDLIARYL